MRLWAWVFSSPPLVTTCLMLIDWSNVQSKLELSLAQYSPSLYFIYFSLIFCKDYISCAISYSIWDIFRPFGHFWVSEGKTSKNIYHFNAINLFLQAQKWWIISLFSILWLIFGHFINPFLNYFFLTFFGHYWVFQHPNNVKSTIFLTFISNSLSRESGK